MIAPVTRPPAIARLASAPARLVSAPARLVLTPARVVLALALVAPASAVAAKPAKATPAEPRPDPTEPSPTEPIGKAQSEPEAAEASPRGGSGRGRRGLSWSRADDPVPERRFLLGVEGVVIQAPPLRPEVVRFDRRFLGRSVSLGGLGLLGRLRLHPRIAVETTVRSGSVRYAGREDESSAVVSQDQVMADLGVLLYVARGDMAQLAFDAGLGGMGTRVVYELDRDGSQRFGSGLVRVGADAEFVFERVAFVVSVRSYGVFTDRDRVSNDGELLEGKALQAPIAGLQTYFVATAGVGYRF